MITEIELTERLEENLLEAGLEAFYLEEDVYFINTVEEEIAQLHIGLQDTEMIKSGYIANIQEFIKQLRKFVGKDYRAILCNSTDNCTFMAYAIIDNDDNIVNTIWM